MSRSPRNSLSEELVQIEENTPFVSEAENGYFTHQIHRLPPYKGNKAFWRDRGLRLAQLCILCLAIWGAYSLTLSPFFDRYSASSTHRPINTDAFICDCGASTEEAQGRGCRFVEMAAAWLPPKCIDSELSDEFDTAGPGPNGEWPYYLDSSRNHQISKVDVAILADTGGVFYSTWEWHVKHCTYQWRLDYRRKWSGTIVEPRYDHESHITHCEGIIFSDQQASVGSIVRLNSSNHQPVLHHEDGSHHVHD
ncbi:hypothetical protein BDV96DRAFT_650397 [Lophiotrema nucula]|uniref:Uncharacterized protein n=1 Tax=Lophiotrema nucula TaxID=690887 RepID=A0A6A5YWT9_9PLEO|nr:hypothetical protein BDV96DRAFT_650397 [Lophiotrema nucula]